MPEINFLNRMEKAPDLPVKIYSLQRAGVSTRKVLEFAKQMGLEAVLEKARLQTEKDRIILAQGQILLQCFKESGGIRFIDQSRWMVDDQKSDLAFDDEKAFEMARAIIKKHKLAKADEFKPLKVTHLHVGSMDEKMKNVQERVIDAGVIFQRMVDGVPVLGPGGKLMIFLDAEGGMTGLEKIWRPIQEVLRKVEGLREPKLAENQLVRFLKTRGIQKADVESAEFGYFELGWHDRQQTLQPAYVFKLRLPLNEGEGYMKSAFVVEAAKNAVGTLIRYKRVMEEQPPRK
jgi:hypothetical protein